MRVLILGAKGMLGQELFRAFSDEEVFGWDREQGDLLQAKTQETIRTWKPDVIVNAVAYNAVDLCETTGRETAYQLNAELPKRLAELAGELQISFVHYSTDYVFDGQKGNYQEEDETNPISEYGKSKQLGERSVLETQGLSYVIRLSRLFGKPAVSVDAKKSFVDVMRELAKTKTEIEVVNEERSSPTYAPDLARLTRWILETQPPGLYHGSNSDSCTWFEFAKEIFSQMEKPLQLIAVSSDRFPRSAKRPAHSVLISTHIPPQRSWKEALKEYL